MVSGGIKPEGIYYLTFMKPRDIIVMLPVLFDKEQVKSVNTLIGGDIDGKENASI